MKSTGENAALGVASILVGVGCLCLYAAGLLAEHESSSPMYFVLKRHVAVHDSYGGMIAAANSPHAEARHYLFPGPLMLAALVAGIAVAVFGLLREGHERVPAGIGLGLNLGMILLAYGVFAFAAFST
jgi:cell division protein FtsW (lipid II flippase)